MATYLVAICDNAFGNVEYLVFNVSLALSAEFRQLNYQEKVISDHYDYNTREKMMNQFENWDSELVDKFVTTNNNHSKPMHQKFVPQSKPNKPIAIESEKPQDRLKTMAYTSSLGELLKNMKKC